MNYKEIAQLLHSARKNKRDIRLTYAPLHKRDSYPWNAEVIMVSLWQSIYQMAVEVGKPGLAL